MASVVGKIFSENASGDGDECTCNPCSNLGRVKEADRFCRDCVEYMCVSCAVIHESFKVSRNHTVSFCGKNSFINMKVASSAEINVPADGYTYVTGSTITPDGRLVLVYDKNGQIILLDRNFTKQSALKLQGDPRDVAADGENDVIVSMGLSKQIQWIHVDGGLKAGRTVTTSDSCWGVAVHSGHIYISVITGEHPYLGGRVEVLTRDGRVVRRIGVDASGPGTFTYPRYITVGASGTLYVADCIREGRITCFSSSGGTVYDVTHSDMQCPRGMVADDDGNLLVCCQYSHEVLVLAKDGSHNRTILTSVDKVAEPWSMAYICSDGTLIVTVYGTPHCRVYKLQYGSQSFQL